MVFEYSLSEKIYVNNIKVLIKQNLIHMFFMLILA